MAPIANFLGKSVGNSTEKTVFKTKENVTQSTSGNTVIDASNKSTNINGGGGGATPIPMATKDNSSASVAAAVANF